MRRNSATWAVVLAAGDGTRLAALTTDASGNSVPKQFCSLTGGRTLIEETLQRARHVASPEQVCTIVAQQHASHWRKLLGTLPRSNVIVQPHNRGTLVRVSLKYDPPGGKAGGVLAGLFGRSPESMIREDLRRFKRVMEAGEIPTTSGQPRGTCH